MDCSHLLLPYAFRSDRLYSWKLGIRHNVLNTDNSLADGLSIHASTKFQTNFTDLKSLKTHFFARKMYTWKFLQFTGLIDGGMSKNLSSIYIGSEADKHQAFALNDRFYLGNFKGIKNIGEQSYKENVLSNNRSKR